MRNISAWKPTKFEFVRGRLRGSRDAREVGVGSRLMTDLVAAQYQAHLGRAAGGRLLDLGCGKVPLYALYAPLVSQVTCVDWAPGEHIDECCDLAQPLPFASASFDTIVLSDVLEHVPEPDLLWREMTRTLAPGGHVIMNVPFYYSVHAHPHDYYRYTNFALERFVRNNGLELVCLTAFGGLPEIVADLFAKAFSKVPWVGPPVAMCVQWAVGAFCRTPPGARISRVSSRHFPLGYFMIARRAH
jgi:SAM-dependent methyltransferase